MDVLDVKVDPMLTTVDELEDAVLVALEEPVPVVEEIYVLRCFLLVEVALVLDELAKVFPDDTW